MVHVLHINVNYAGTALHQKLIEHLDRYTKNQVFVPIYPLTEDQLAIKPNENVLISQCYNKRDRLVFSYKGRKIFKSLERSLDVRGFDCVHAYTLFTDGNCALQVKRKYGIPYIAAVRDTDVNHFFRKAIHLRPRGISILREAEKLVFLSAPYKEYLLEHYVPCKLREEIERKAVVIPNGIDDSWFENLYTGRDIEKSEGRFRRRQLRVVSVGVLTKRKNYPATIAALKTLQSRGWEVRLDVIGQASDPAVLSLIQSTAFARYHGKLPQEQVRELYRENDIFLLPSITETFGLSYAEALSQQLPVLYTAGQGFDRQFPDGTVGFAVDSGDPIQIADRIVEVTERYRQLAGSCAAASKRFNWEPIAAEYNRIYRGVCNKR